MNPPNRRVLLVDDDPALRRILSHWLRGADFDVREAGNGMEALAAIEADCPDFLITDWEMPVVDGPELCRRVRASNLPKYVYILFLTIRSAPAEMITGLEIGADDYLGKPILQGELLARMRAAGRIVALERRLSEMARTDPLTRLWTQRTFYEVLEKEWERVSRSGAPLSCAMIDLDFFKRVNDMHGHPVGDAVLKTITEILLRNCRASDTICRYGGEEFCALLPDTTEEAAVAWAERLRASLSGTVIRGGGTELRVTASFGVAQRRDDTQTSAGLVDQADQALLCAKQSGRDRVVSFELLNSARQIDLDESDQHGIFRGITARHVMSPMVVGLHEDETVGQAAEFFLRSRINSTPVVNREGKLVGILSEKDLLATMVSFDSWESPVRDVMKPNVICYDEDTPIRVVYEFLCRVSIRRVVIVADGCPVGTISRGTLLRWFRNLVLSKGLVETTSTPEPHDEKDPHRSKDRLAETAETIAGLARELQRRLREDPRDLVPFVVGGATRMQELVTDLLAFSRYANDAGQTGAAAIRSMHLTGGHTD
ncbi:MAG: diguanylate cyclase [Pirellulales bacterium]|nr:diguanylate cyclase [Pirellulales bacterium]